LPVSEVLFAQPKGSGLHFQSQVDTHGLPVSEVLFAQPKGSGPHFQSQDDNAVSRGFRSKPHSSSIAALRRQFTRPVSLVCGRFTFKAGDEVRV